MSPYLPFTSQKILEYLNIDKSINELRWSDAEKTLLPGHRIKEPKPLFKKIDERDIREKIKKLEEIRKSFS
jgi:methionyl-tRNA synthetase